MVLSLSSPFFFFNFFNDIVSIDVSPSALNIPDHLRITAGINIQATTDDVSICLSNISIELMKELLD